MLFRFVAVTVAAFAWGVAAPPAHAAEPPVLQGVGTLIDDLVTTSMAEEKVPGAAVTVVARGETVFSKGYGWADVEHKVPVDPARTRFLIGSETKLFTAQAALQLVQAGRLDLDADVNRYLEAFKVDDTYPGRPVTLRHLLTHTAGFDEDFVVGSASDVKPLGIALAETQPARVRPPGTAVTYSNYGVALAGYLVEVVSGLSYADYVTQHVLAPLGMAGTSIACGGQDVATAYLADGAATDVRCANYSASGAGPVSTAADMSRYMIAQLAKDPRLGTGVAEQMQRQQYTEHPALAGMGYMFEQHPYQGHPMLFKGGDMPGMHAFMILLPDQGIGIHVVSNGDGAGGSGVDGLALAERIVDRHLPAVASPEVTPLRSADSGQYEGSYLTSRTSHGSLFKIRSLLRAPVHVASTADGGLRTTGLGGKEKLWIQVEPGVFAERAGWGRIAFPEPGVLAVSGATAVYDRIGLLDHPGLHVGLLIFGVVVLSVSALALPVVAVARRTRRRPAHSRAAKIARGLAWLTAVLVVGFVVGFGSLAADQSLALPIILQGAPVLTGLLVLATVTVPLALGLVVCAAAAWRARWWRLPGRLSYTVIALAAAAFAVVAITYNLVGPPYT
ncbi:MAG: serine hydrolase domain-containing protein [Kibdelosporangium sp.]